MRWLVIVLLVLHGLIHLIGAPASWGGGITGLTAVPLIPLAGAALRLAGVGWLLATLLLLVAALGLAFRRGWWPVVAFVGVVVSQVLIVCWWRDARFGTVPNLVILAAAIWFAMPDWRRASSAAGAPA